MFRASLLSLILAFSTANPINAADPFAREEKNYLVTEWPVVCIPTVQIVSILSAKPNMRVLVFDKENALSLISAFVELTNQKPRIPVIAIDGLVFAYAQGDPSVSIGIVVGEDVCQKLSINVELANDLLNFGQDT